MSKLEINNSIYLEFKVGGQNLTEDINVFEEILIIENINQLLPTLSFTIGDTTNTTIKKLHLTDGIPIQVRMSKTKDDNPPNLNFRLFNGDVSRTYSSGHFNKFNCVLDAPKYLSSIVRKGLKGNSSDAIKFIASECDLSYKGGATSDEQIWLGAGITYGQWAKKVAKNGYASDNSCMVIAVNEVKELMYIDIIELMVGGRAEKKLQNSMPVDGKSNSIQIYSNNSATTSGFMNSWVNYGYAVHGNNINNKEVFLDKVQVRKKEQAIALNTDVKSQVGLSRLDMLNFNCGNTNEKFERAEYQNLRLKSSFTETLSVILLDYSNIKLLDVVDVEIGHSVEDLTPTNKSGSYIVASKTKIIRAGVNYGERLELIRNSTRHEGINQLER